VDQGELFSYIARKNPPLRMVRELTSELPNELNLFFGRPYADKARPSIPPVQLLSASLPPVFYRIRSERQLME